jgi:hypothetical protein
VWRHPTPLLLAWHTTTRRGHVTPPYRPRVAASAAPSSTAHREPTRSRPRIGGLVEAMAKAQMVTSIDTTPSLEASSLFPLPPPCWQGQLLVRASHCHERVREWLCMVWRRPTPSIPCLGVDACQCVPPTYPGESRNGSVRCGSGRQHPSPIQAWKLAGARLPLVRATPRMAPRGVATAETPHTPYLGVDACLPVRASHQRRRV